MSSFKSIKSQTTGVLILQVSFAESFSFGRGALSPGHEKAPNDDATVDPSGEFIKYVLMAL